MLQAKRAAPPQSEAAGPRLQHQSQQSSPGLQPWHSEGKWHTLMAGLGGMYIACALTYLLHMQLRRKHSQRKLVTAASTHSRAQLMLLHLHITT